MEWENMLDMETLANISSVITCISLLIMIIGSVWKTFISMNLHYEELYVLPFGEDEEIMDEYDNILDVDSVGTLFAISSTYGIKNIRIFNVTYDGFGDNEKLQSISKKLRANYGMLNSNEKLLIRADLGEVLPILRIEIERNDFVNVSFDVYTSGKNGHVLSNNYEFRPKIRSFLYYFFM